MSKVLVTGSNGQVGSELRALSSQYPQYEFTFSDRSSLDLSQIESIETFFSQHTFDFIINCAAFTSVDKAETESQMADLLNHQVIEALAKIAKKNKISLIHLSTDYVFDGKNFRPYVESDPTKPVNAYGKSKCAGEEELRSIAPANSIIIRSSWIYSRFGNNFMKTMLKLGRERDTLGVIYDQIGTPTSAKDLAQTILEILPKIKNQVPEIYNYSNEGIASWYDFAKAIFETSNIACTVNPLTTEQYPTPAARPHYSVLNKSKIKKEFGISIPYWKDSLKVCLQQEKEI
jgi:dTDP-4-dehydrorhamnose reductase